MGESDWNCYSATKRTLENLCVANAWSFATFWAFDLSNPMLLTLEDAYYEDRLRSQIHNLLLNKVHVLGQGIIGQAALNGKHQWILADEFGLDRNSFQVDSEIYSQFSFGIKTIVAIPVEPRGVIKFGSTHKICESLEFVDQAIRAFREIHGDVDQAQYDTNAMFSSTSTSYFGQDLCSDNYLQGGPGTVIDDHGRYSQPSIFEGLFEDFNPDDFPTTEDLSRWLAPSPPPPPPEDHKSFDDLTRLVESTSTQKDTLGPRSTFASGPRKGLFSELGIEELLAGGSSSATSCLTSSNLDRSCLGKRREAGKSQVGLWIDDTYSIVAPSSSNVVVPSSSSKQQQKSNEDQRRVVKKRARPGESMRTRPKDRQLIQDRIKELRGIIPNSSKCSIDALLERTMKYMAFLQGVTKHGDKLKQPTKTQLIGGENGAVHRDKSKINGGGGATWAYEVGGQSMACPIIVEDLSQPGQMLIEMLCEEQGFFLEIADVIRGFGLSILKGVMEARGNKIWAHFIVEAKSHVTRIDVFWSLVRVLQRTINSDDKPSGNAVSDNGIPLMESYHKPNLPRPICVTETL